MFVVRGDGESALSVHEMASHVAAPCFYATLQCSQLAVWECSDVLQLQTLEEFLGGFFPAPSRATRGQWARLWRRDPCVFANTALAVAFGDGLAEPRLPAKPSPGPLRIDRARHPGLWARSCSPDRPRPVPPLPVLRGSRPAGIMDQGPRTCRAA